MERWQLSAIPLKTRLHLELHNALCKMLFFFFFFTYSFWKSGPTASAMSCSRSYSTPAGSGTHYFLVHNILFLGAPLCVCGDELFITQPKTLHCTRRSSPRPMGARMGAGIPPLALSPLSVQGATNVWGRKGAQRTTGRVFAGNLFHSAPCLLKTVKRSSPVGSSTQ